MEKSVDPVHLNIQRFSAGHSSWPLQLAHASQPGWERERALLEELCALSAGSLTRFRLKYDAGARASEDHVLSYIAWKI